MKLFPHMHMHTHNMLQLLYHSPHLVSQLVQQLLVFVGQEATALLLRRGRKRWGLGECEGRKERRERERVGRGEGEGKKRI